MYEQADNQAHVLLFAGLSMSSWSLEGTLLVSAVCAPLIVLSSLSFSSRLSPCTSFFSCTLSLPLSSTSSFDRSVAAGRHHAPTSQTSNHLQTPHKIRYFAFFFLRVILGNHVFVLAWINLALLHLTSYLDHVKAERTELQVQVQVTHNFKTTD